MLRPPVQHCRTQCKSSPLCRHLWTSHRTLVLLQSPAGPPGNGQTHLYYSVNCQEDFWCLQEAQLAGEPFHCSSAFPHLLYSLTAAQTFVLVHSGGGMVYAHSHTCSAGNSTQAFCVGAEQHRTFSQHFPTQTPGINKQYHLTCRAQANSQAKQQDICNCYP